MKKEAVNILHIPFQVLDEAQLVEINRDELETPALYSIWCVSAEQCVYLSNASEGLRNNDRIIWVPIGAALSSVFPKQHRHTISEFSILTYLKKLGEYCEEIGAETCLVMDTQQQAEQMLNVFRETFPYLTLHTLSMDLMYSDEALVNEINSVAPDILVLGLPMDVMKRYVENNRHRTNSRLCICLGDSLLGEMTKKKKTFHTMTMRRNLKRALRKSMKKERKSSDQSRKGSKAKNMGEAESEG